MSSWRPLRTSEICSFYITVRPVTNMPNLCIPDNPLHYQNHLTVRYATNMLYLCFLDNWRAIVTFCKTSYCAIWHQYVSPMWAWQPLRNRKYFTPPKCAIWNQNASPVSHWWPLRTRKILQTNSLCDFQQTRCNNVVKQNMIK